MSASTARSAAAREISCRSRKGTKQGYGDQGALLFGRPEEPLDLRGDLVVLSSGAASVSAGRATRQVRNVQPGFERRGQSRAPPWSGGVALQARRRRNEVGAQKIEAWDDASLRCLHLCFLRRSSRDPGDRARRNIPDQNAPRRAPRRAWTRLRELAGVPEQSAWKDHYRVGPIEVVSAEPFFDVTRAL